MAHIPEFIEFIEYRPIHLALTATATNLTINKIKKYLNLSNPNIVISNCDRSNIFYRVVKNENKLNICEKNKNQFDFRVNNFDLSEFKILKR
jgi:superfamily II DNA helicase RecQ